MFLWNKSLKDALKSPVLALQCSFRCMVSWWTISRGWSNWVPQQGGLQEWLPGADDDDHNYNGSGPASQYFIHLDILMLMMIIIRNQQQMHEILKLKSQEQNQKVQVYECGECGKCFEDESYMDSHIKEK